MRRPGWHLLLALGLGLGMVGLGGPACSADASPSCKSSDLFERRILPLLQADQPSSCSECHLAGIDLGMFARSTPCETMACLVQDQLVDLDAPKQSKILTFIGRAEPDSDLITEDVIQAEYDGFLEWIESEAECRECKRAKCGDAEAPFCDAGHESPAIDESADPGGCDDKTIEQLFLDTVYASRARCSPCHFEKKEVSPEIIPPPPRWIRQEGSCEAASLATLRTVERSGYINVEDPSQSLLLLKPLAVDDGGVEHGGGAKFHSGDDPVYINLTYFVERYAACKSAE